MKITLINTLYSPYKIGGAEVSVQILAEELVALGNEVTILTLAEAGLQQSDIISGVRIERFRLWNIYWPYSQSKPSALGRALWHLVDIFNPIMGCLLFIRLKGNKPNVIHTNNIGGFSCAVWLVAKVLGVPIVHTVRDYYLLNPNASLYENGKVQSGFEGKSRFFSYMKKLLFKLVDTPIGISDSIVEKHRLMGFQKEGEWKTVFNPVCQVDTTTLPARKNADNRSPLTYGFIGRLEEKKGITELLDVYSNMPECFRDEVRLIIAGVGDLEYTSKLIGRYASKNVNFVGFKSFSDFITDVDLVVVPSLWDEPFGRVVVESYAYGVPVLTANTGGLPELVQPETGVIFDARIPEEFASALMDSLEKLKRSYFSSDFIRGISKNYSASKIATIYQKIYMAVK
ncbi:glycosyltransferase family 4 protein [Pseudomonadales bacterium]|nr:glycosyltransferase family 4 protein [Pseudomonadales bacterium]